MRKNKFIYNQELINKAEQKTFKKINSFQVMQKAAKACYSFIVKNINTKKILVVCGPGNNGGDGILIAIYLLRKNIDVDIYYPLGFPKTNDAKKALNLLPNKKKIKKNIVFKNYTLIIDALFGIGFNKKLNSLTISLINKINKSQITTLSIDMPSGIFTNNGNFVQTAIKANITLSFHRYKPGQWLLPGKEYCGKVILLNIGLINIDNQCFLQLNYPQNIPIPSISSHKFSRGCCMIVAGDNLVGASKLAFFAASQSILRAGAGLCKILVNEKNLEFFKPHILEEMIITYKNDKDFISTIKKQKCNTIIYGCGIDNKLTNKKILTFLLKMNINLILDAVVFSLFQKDKKNFISLLNKRNFNTIMTPHEGEFKRIFNISNNKVSDCLQAAQKTNSIIVYKGNDTVIGSPDGKAYINAESSSYLATAGSGDVLAGLIGGFLSQQIEALNAAQLGCFIHSHCGINSGPGLIASDLVKEIPKVIKKMIK